MRDAGNFSVKVTYRNRAMSKDRIIRIHCSVANIMGVKTPLSRSPRLPSDSVSCV